MLKHVLKLTSVGCQTCLTPGEHIFKYCLQFLSINCRHCTASFMAAAHDSHATSTVNVYSVHGTLHHLRQSSSMCCLNGVREPQCGTFLSFVSTVETYMRKKSYESVIRLEYGSPISQLFQNQTRLTVEGCHFQHPL
jgi:hypothetical protein